MKLIIGLGNPGKEYDNTRHNAGFMVIDNYAKTKGIEINKNKFNGLYNEFVFNGEKVILLKPLSYMNLSGEVVKKYVDYFKINIENILIINDDMDIALGKYKLKASGSSAGHNGLKNISQNLGTDSYKRLKIGISKNNIEMKDYVLGKFNTDELVKLNEVIKNSESILNDYLALSFDNLMNRYNHKG